MNNDNKRFRMLRPMLFLGLVILSCTAFADSALWYKWQSKLNNTVICAQTFPGEGWLQMGGPFIDAHCVRAVIYK